MAELYMLESSNWSVADNMPVTPAKSSLLTTQCNYQCT